MKSNRIQSISRSLRIVLVDASHSQGLDRIYTPIVPRMNKEIMGRIHAGRRGTADDLNGAFFFLALDGAEYARWDIPWLWMANGWHESG